MRRYDDIPAKLEACRAYMARFGLLDCEATRTELADALGIPARVIEGFSRYGRLGVSAA